MEQISSKAEALFDAHLKEDAIPQMARFYYKKWSGIAWASARNII